MASRVGDYRRCAYSSGHGVSTLALATVAAFCLDWGASERLVDDGESCRL